MGHYTRGYYIGGKTIESPLRQNVHNPSFVGHSQAQARQLGRMLQDSFIGADTTGLIPLPPPEYTAGLNNMLAQQVKSHKASGKDITFVDLFTPSNVCSSAPDADDCCHSYRGPHGHPHVR